MTDEPLAAGVVGVGSMGQNHVRIYDELRSASLVGVTDVDVEQSNAVAERFGTRHRPRAELLEAADVVSIATPTETHYDLVRECIDAGVHVLVEKPFVLEPSAGRDLISRADAADVTLQVGFVERFNPAVEAVQEFVSDLDVLAVDARRLGPPPERTIDDSAVLDLMIHDIDVVLSLLDTDVRSFSAYGTGDGRHVVAQTALENDAVATLTASRITQQKVRKLTVTAKCCQISVDYLRQSVEIHRHSLPEYVVEDGDVRHRIASVVERPTVENGEPLKRELGSFVDAVRRGERPRVTGEDALQSLELALGIEAATETVEVPEVTQA